MVNGTWLKLLNLPRSLKGVSLAMPRSCLMLRHMLMPRNLRPKGLRIKSGARSWTWRSSDGENR